MQRQKLTLPSGTSDRIPFKDFLQLAAFVASIGISLSLAASQTLGCTTIFMGKTDNETLDSVRQAAIYFTWAAAVFGLALALSFSAQLLLTSPRVQAMLQPGQTGKLWMRVAVGSVSWMSLFLVVGGLVLVSKGLNPVDSRAGGMFQWAVVAIAASLSVFWIVILLNFDYETNSQ